MISSLSGGGAENVCISIANSFANNNWTVDLVILNLNDDVFSNRLSNKINLTVLNVKHARSSIIPLLKYIYQKRVNNVLVFNYELSVILVILRTILKLKINIITRNINTISIKIKKFGEQNFWTRYVVKNLIKYFYQKSDHIVNQCEYMQNDLITYFPKVSKNSSVIFNPLPEHLSNFIKNCDFNKIIKRNYLLCVGRLEKQKAFHLAIKAFAGISEEFPNLRLKIVGKGILENDLKQEASKLNILNKIDFEGFQKNIIPYYLYANATLLTSSYEGYPNVLIESIAMNTPVISFDCPGGPNEIINNGINGFLVKYPDVKDFQKKIKIIFERKFNYEDLKKSVEKNQIDKVFKKYENLFNSFK